MPEPSGKPAWQYWLSCAVTGINAEGQYRRAGASTLIAQLLHSLPALPKYRGHQILGRETIDATEWFDVVVFADSTEFRGLLQDLIDTIGTCAFRGGYVNVQFSWHSISPL